MQRKIITNQAQQWAVKQGIKESRGGGALPLGKHTPMLGPIFATFDTTKGKVLKACTRKGMGFESPPGKEYTPGHGN